MYYKEEFDVNDFEFHDGAEQWVEEFREKGKLKDLGSAIEEVFHGNTPTAEEINDLVWFDEYIHSLVEDEEDEEGEETEEDGEEDSDEAL